MASMALITSTFTKFQAANKLAMVLGKPWTSKPFIPASPRNCQAIRRYGAMATCDEAAEAAKQGRDTAKKGVDAAMRGGQQLKQEASSAVDNAGQRMDGMTGNMSSAAQDATGKMKRTAEEAWGSVKDTAQNIKDKVSGKADAAADGAGKIVKQEAAKIDRAMNTKN